MQLVVNNLLTAYEEIGTGKSTILFLHGWADNGKTFEMLARDLAKKNKKYKMVLLDLPGFGGSQAPSEVWDLREYSEFVAEFIKKSGQQPDVIVGHSNGGAIAINGQASGVLSVKKLILIASAGIRNPSLKKTALLLLAKPAKLAIKATPKNTQDRIRQKLYKAVGSDYLIAEHLQESFKKIVATDVRGDASKLTLPTCIIYGDKDIATPDEYGRIFSEIIAGSQLHIIPFASHFVHQEQVYKVSNIITDFIK